MWNYTKGSEADFEGAPDWCTVMFSNALGTRHGFAEKWEFGVKFVYRDRHNRLVYGDRLNGWYRMGRVVAQRERVNTINDNRLIQDLIAERGSRYGKFSDGAAIMQQLKQVMHAAPNWEKLSPSQKEALEMIQHKIGRILNGDPNYDDNWKDIAGYSTRVLEELK